MNTNNTIGNYLADSIAIEVGTMTPTDKGVAALVGTVGVMRLTFGSSADNTQLTVDLVGNLTMFNQLASYVQASRTRVRDLLRETNEQSRQPSPSTPTPEAADPTASSTEDPA